MSLPLRPLAVGICGFDYPSHFDEWGALAEKHKRLLVVASRDHGKTTFFSKLLPLSRVIENENYEICVISYSDTQVTKIVTGVKDLIDSKPFIKTLKKNNDEDWSKTALKFKNGAKIDSLTFGSSGRGGHYDLVLVDDPVKDFGGMNPDDQEAYFQRAIIPMVKPDGQLIVVGNFVYDNDLVERIERNGAYHVALYPAISGGKALWPERWPIEKLEERQREVGSYAFAREYLLEKIDPKTQFFKRSMIRYYERLPERMAKVVSVDPAISTGGDYTAIVATGTDESNKTYVLDYANLRTDNIQEIVDEIFRIVQATKAPYIQIETIGFQRLLKHWIYDAMRERDYHFGIEEIRTHNKSKQARIMALQPRIEAGSLLFHPTKHEEIISQLLAFPRGLHDDLIDAASFQVGKWDKPDILTQEAPTNSFEWWQKQATPVETSWQSGLGLL